MKNFERYKDEIIQKTNEGLHLDCTLAEVSGFVKDHDTCNGRCFECCKNTVKWMYTDDILDEVEREYLSHFIKPFRNDIASIVKYGNTDEEIREYISIEYKEECDDYSTNLRYFKAGTMYKGMELGNHYTLEQLGL